MKVRGLWGLEIEPERATQVKVDGSFKITMASVSSFNGPERTSIYMEFQDKRFLLCSLIPEKIEQQVVDITCLKGEQITFRSVGPNGVHLMGNYISQGDSDNESEEENSDSESVEDKEVEGILEKKEPIFDDLDEYEDTPEIEEVDSDEEFDVSKLCHYLDTAFGFKVPPHNTVDRSNNISDQNKSGCTTVDVIEPSKEATKNPASKTPTPVKQIKQPVSKQQVVEKTSTESSKPQEPKSKKTVSRRNTDVLVIKGPRPKRISRSEARKLLEQQQQQQQQQKETPETVITETNETELSNNATTPNSDKRAAIPQDKKKVSKPKKAANNKPVEEDSVESIETITNEEKSKNSEPEVGIEIMEETENDVLDEVEERVENTPIKKKKHKPKKVKTPVESIPDAVNQVEKEVTSQESTDVESPDSKKRKKSKSKKNLPIQLVETEEVNRLDHQEEEPDKTDTPKKIGSKKPNAPNKEETIDLEIKVETKTNEERGPESRSSESNEEVEDRSEKRFELGKDLEKETKDISHFTFEELLELEKEHKRLKKERKKRKKEARLRKENQSVTEGTAPASTPDVVATINADAIPAADITTTADATTTAAAARAVTTDTKKSIYAVNNKNLENLKKYPKRKASGQAAEKLGVMARADALMAQSVKREELKRKKSKTSNL